MALAGIHQSGVRGRRLVGELAVLVELALGLGDVLAQHDQPRVFRGQRPGILQVLEGVLQIDIREVEVFRLQRHRVSADVVHGEQGIALDGVRHPYLWDGLHREPSSITEGSDHVQDRNGTEGHNNSNNKAESYTDLGRKPEVFHYSCLLGSTRVP